jgi:2-oxo-hept-3-ene-1,7-dioate hydratase
MTIDDAYAVQQAWTRIKLNEGRTIRGRKIGLTSKAMQSSIGINEPDYGVLFDDMFYADGARIPVDSFIQLRVEVELAFVMGRPLQGAECTIYDVLNATDYVVPAMEILDTRIQRVDPERKTTRRIVDTISDNAANAALVLGGRPSRPLDIDMRWVAAILSRNGEVEETGVAAGVLNHPANGLVWLVQKLAPHGEGLESGQVVLSGSFTRPVEVVRGDTFTADFGPLGSVSCHFA